MDRGNGNNYPDDNSGGPPRYTAAITVIVSVLFVVALVRLARFILDQHKEEHQGRGPGAAADGGSPSRVVVAVEVQAGPMVYAYRRGDGWREATCPVCLSDFTDGETLRVLPACMHYFHAACVGEWLRNNTTCPLCRYSAAAAIAGRFSGQGHRYFHGMRDWSPVVRQPHCLSMFMHAFACPIGNQFGTHTVPDGCISMFRIMAKVQQMVLGRTSKS